MADLEGKVAVITGAGSGMGRAAAKLFAQHGAKVVAADISGREEETAAAIGVHAIAVHCDVTVEAQVEAMMAAALRAFGKVSAVLNVAGIAISEKLSELKMENYDRVLDVDLRGVVHGMKHGIRAMLASAEGGSIINYSSTGGLGASVGGSTYGMAKAGVVSVTKTAALEYATAGIRANAICPGPILTEMWGPNPPPDRVAARIKSIPMGRLGRPEEVAEVAVFLASDRSSFVTGTIIPVDGGNMAQVP
jgi:NAD(P)-dependent dehydrogenase (short-subunit alcohol dehydrogenase family)